MSLTVDTTVNAPTLKADRYVVMDALRGFALLGVMLINLYGFGGVDVLITAEQLAALPSAALDERVEFWLRLLVYDKANTLFAFLFGLGFWFQMERLEARGTPFRSIYLRRAGNGPAADLVAGDIRIDVEGSAASVRIELEDWTGHRFTDFFTLVRIEGDCKIMSRVL